REERRRGSAGGARAGRVRIERAARNRSAKEADDLSRDAGADRLAMCARRRAGARARSADGRERAAVALGQPERAVAVVLDDERPPNGVVRPGRSTGSVVRGGKGERELAVPGLVVAALVTLAVAAGVRRSHCGEAQRGERECE